MPNRDIKNQTICSPLVQQAVFLHEPAKLFAALRLCADNAWLTIMSNINIVAVAALTDTACILLCEGVSPEKSILDAAQSKGINILRSDLATYETAMLLRDCGA